MHRGFTALTSVALGQDLVEALLAGEGQLSPGPLWEIREVGCGTEVKSLEG